MSQFIKVTKGMETKCHYSKTYVEKQNTMMVETPPVRLSKLMYGCLRLDHYCQGSALQRLRNF